MRSFPTLVLLALCSTPRHASAQNPVPRLVGTWRLVEFCTLDRLGDTTYTLGRGPLGFFVYDAAGNLSIQAMRASPPRAFMSDSIPLAGMAEVRSSYFGYFGSYTVTSDSTVTHHVTGGTIPSYIGTDQPRNYRFRGDTLSISADDTWSCRKLIRVR